MSLIPKLKKKTKKWAEKKGYVIEKMLPAETRHGKEADLRFYIAEFVIHSLLQSDPESEVVQIGAFDGKSNDFLFEAIRQFPVKTVLVEPQPEAFRLLCQNYEDQKNVIPVNAAMSWKDETLSLFRIKTEFHSAFRLAPQLASFDRQHLLNALFVPHLKGLPDDREMCVEAIDVEGISFATLLTRYGLSRVDILQIDTEGFDFEVLKMIDFKSVKPKVINFEIVHLSFEDLNAAIELLVSHGYRTMRYGINMLAMQMPETGVEQHFYEGSSFESLNP